MNCWPKPIQKPHPPIYIPGGGSIETWDFCIDHDYNYSYLSFSGYLAGKRLMDGYWERVAARGVDDSPYRAAFAQIICVADTDAEAKELYEEHVLYFYNRCLHVYPGFADAPGYRTIKTMQAGALNQLTAAAQRRFSELTWENLVENGNIIAGSPETVVDRMKDMITNLRVGTVFCLLHNGNQPDWKTRYSTKLFAEKVMPKLQDMWPDHEGDDRWWCKPLANRVDPTETIGGKARSELSETGPRRDGPGPGIDDTAGARRAASSRAVPTAASPSCTSTAWAGSTSDDPSSHRLAERYRVHAPELPGYGESTGEELLEDMLDFTLHGWDVVDALGLDRPHRRRPLDGRDDRRRDGVRRQRPSVEARARSPRPGSGSTSTRSPTCSACSPTSSRQSCSTTPRRARRR